MENEALEFRKIDDRCRELKKWILENAPQAAEEEKQLVEGSEEQAYWAHGYLSALLDVKRLFSRDVPGMGSTGADDTRSRYAA